MHGRCHVHLRQVLPALSVVQSDQCTALQRQPHALTVCHHTGHTPTAVRAHLEPVLRRRDKRHGVKARYTHLIVCLSNNVSPRTHIHPSIFPLASCTSVVVLMIRTLFCDPHHSFPPTGTILVTGLLGVPITNIWED